MPTMVFFYYEFQPLDRRSFSYHRPLPKESSRCQRRERKRERMREREREDEGERKRG